jgi:hypothetical protein
MNQFYPAQNDRSGAKCLESEHRSNPAFDPSMILLDDVVEIGSGAKLRLSGAQAANEGLRCKFQI